MRPLRGIRTIILHSIIVTKIFVVTKAIGNNPSNGTRSSKSRSSNTGLVRLSDEVTKHARVIRKGQLKKTPGKELNLSYDDGYGVGYIGYTLPFHFIRLQGERAWACQGVALKFPLPVAVRAEGGIEDGTNRNREHTARKEKKAKQTVGLWGASTSEKGWKLICPIF